MSGPVTPFLPIGNSVTHVPVATTSSPQALGSTTLFGETLKVSNTCGADIGIRWGAGAQIAVTTDPTVKSGETRVFSVPQGVDNFATFARAAVSGTVDVQRGAGSI